MSNCTHRQDPYTFWIFLFVLWMFLTTYPDPYYSCNYTGRFGLAYAADRDAYFFQSP